MIHDSIKAAARKWSRKLWREWIVPLTVVGVTFGAVRSSVADWNDVPTGSMKPTILEGDRIFVNKLAYGLRIPFTMRWVALWDTPERGDIVICFSPIDGTRLVKRIIGLPRDTIAMRNNQLYVNARAISYGVPQDDDIDQIDLEDRNEHYYFTERLGLSQHAIMLTPTQPSIRSFGPIQIPAGQYFVMGDNRDRSSDSRIFGYVNGTDILGRAPVVALSMDPNNHYIPRWDRFMRELR